jgi:uncharacterized protein YqgV (UPF0045/DUF77 family)
MSIQAQVSVYPLGQSELAPAVEAVWEAFESHGLSYQSGSMSTSLEGKSDQVFAGLRDAFEAACEYGGTVMVITVSNACPARQPPKVGPVHA